MTPVASAPLKPNPPPCSLQGRPNAADPNCRNAVAAEQSAQFAKWSFWAVIVGILIAIGQIIALVITIRQTRAAVTAAQKSANAADVAASAAILGQRPWVQVDLFETGDMTSGADGVRCTFRAVVRNLGQMPATNLETWAYLWIDGLRPADLERKASEAEGFVLFPAAEESRQAHALLLPEQNVQRPGEAVHHQHLVVTIEVAYRFPGGQGRSSREYQVVGPHLMNAFDMRKLPITASDFSLKLRPYGDVAT